LYLQRAAVAAAQTAARVKRQLRAAPAAAVHTVGQKQARQERQVKATAAVMVAQRLALIPAVVVAARDLLAQTRRITTQAALAALVNLLRLAARQSGMLAAAALAALVVALAALAAMAVAAMAAAQQPHQLQP
jgi:hypothetical protein